MKIFLTGATGYIGSAVLDAALRANHQITALVRTPQAADALASRGVTPVLGDLKTLKSYRAAADAHDAYIHTAADSSPKREEVDRKAIDTLMGLAAARAQVVARVVRVHVGHLGSRIECAADGRDGSGQSGAVARLAARATSSSCCRRRRRTCARR